MSSRGILARNAVAGSVTIGAAAAVIIGMTSSGFVNTDAGTGYGYGYGYGACPSASPSASASAGVTTGVTTGLPTTGLTGILTGGTTGQPTTGLTGAVTGIVTGILTGGVVSVPGAHPADVSPSCPSTTGTATGVLPTGSGTTGSSPAGTTTGASTTGLTTTGVVISPTPSPTPSPSPSATATAPVCNPLGKQHTPDVALDGGQIKKGQRKGLTARCLRPGRLVKVFSVVQGKTHLVLIVSVNKFGTVRFFYKPTVKGKLTLSFSGAAFDGKILRKKFNTTVK